MKRFLSLIIMLIAISVNVFAYNNLAGTPSSYPMDRTQEATITQTSILPIDDGVIQLGDSTHRFRNIFLSSNGITTQEWLSLPIASTVTVYDMAVTTTVALSSTVYSGGSLFQFPYARNLVAQFRYEPSVYGTEISSLTVYGGKCVVQGINQYGTTVSETLTAYQSSGTVGSIAFLRVDTVTFSASYIQSDTAWAQTATKKISLQLGTGVKIGLLSGSTIIKDVESGTVYTTYTLDTVYNTITFVNAPDTSKNYIIMQKR